MKKLCTKILSIVILASLLLSCEKEENLQPEGLWTLSEPGLISEGLESTIVLDETTPNENITLSWDEAESSAGFAVTYEVMIDTEGANFSNPLISRISSNQGKGNSLSINYGLLDETLSFLGVKAGQTTNLQWAVRATSLTRTSLSIGTLTLQRFISETLPSQLFISGTATENNNDIENAIPMRRLTNSLGGLSNIYEVYTSLKAGGSYKFYSQQSLRSVKYGVDEDGNLEVSGNDIIAAEDGVYRITVNIDTNTISLLKINFWSMVGFPIVNAWEGDEPLAYQGNGIFSASINLINTGGFLFRANEDWDLVLKRVIGTPNTVAFETDAPSQGLEVEDIPSEQTGLFKVTLDLSANAYTYTFERDTTIPTELYLFENDIMIEQFDANGSLFSIPTFVPMQASASYRLNTAADGSGTSYSVNENLAQSLTPDGDKVSDVQTLLQSDNTFSVVTDRALRLEVDFNAPNITWTYYNFKLFHWLDWPDRVENVMEYIHPNTYVVSTDLSAGFNSKFISPWDFDLGSTESSALLGDASVEGTDIVNITTDGNYTVTIVLEPDYQSGTYQFVQQ